MMQTIGQSASVDAKPFHTEIPIAKAFKFRPERKHVRKEASRTVARAVDQGSDSNVGNKIFPQFVDGSVSSVGDTLVRRTKMAKIVVINGVWSFIVCSMFVAAAFLYTQETRHEPGNYHLASLQESMQGAARSLSVD